MGLVSLGSIRGGSGTGAAGREVEYGSDGSPWGGVQFTPWPGLMNDLASMPIVTRDVAVGLPGVGRGVELIAGVVAQLEPQLYRDQMDPTKVSIQLSTPPLLSNPDPSWHGLDSWLTAATDSLAWYGNSFAYRGPEVCDTRGYPLRLPLLETEGMTWEQGQYHYQSSSGGHQAFDSGDVLHFVIGALAGKRMGQGILSKHQTELKIMVATEQAQFVLMSAGKPLGIISLGNDVTPEEAGEYKAAFMQAIATDGVAAMGQADFKPVAWNAADLSMVPTREFNLRLASDIVGVPPYLLGVPSESRVYSNMETEWTNFIRTTLGRYVKALETGLTTCYPKGQSVLLGTSRLVQADLRTRWDTYQIAANIGALTVNEIRAMENMEPLPEPVVEEEPEPPAEQAVEDSTGQEEVPA